MVTLTTPLVEEAVAEEEVVAEEVVMGVTPGGTHSNRHQKPRRRRKRSRKTATVMEVTLHPHRIPETNLMSRQPQRSAGSKQKLCSKQFRARRR